MNINNSKDVLRRQIEIYSERDMALIPLKEKNKLPLEVGYNKKQYTTERLSFHVKKNKNLGFLLGPHDLIIDVDIRKRGLDGLEQLQDDWDDWEIDLSTILATVKTGGGGFHFYLKLPSEINPKTLSETHPDYPGIEFKHQGRYVVIPGSIHPETNEMYTWKTPLDKNKEPPIAPDWLIEKLKKSKRESPAKGNSTSNAVAKDPKIAPEELEKLLDQLPVEEYAGNPTWEPIMMAAHHATRGRGLKVFLAWSLGDPAYSDQKDEITNRWKSLKLDPENPITIATLDAEIIKHGGTPYRQSARDDFDDEISKPEGKKGLLLNQNKTKKITLGNTIKILREHPSWQGVLGYDIRSYRAYFLTHPPQPPWSNKTKLPREISDHDGSLCAEWFQEVKMGIPSSMVLEALTTIARENEFDPVKDYFDSLHWDRKNRIDTWLIDYARAEDTEYIRKISRKFLISGVARTYEPGCKVDTTLILHGSQGIYKSELLRSLAGDEFFTDNLGDLGNKDSRLQLQGPLIIEMAELDAMSKRESSTIKAFLSANEDRFRPPYGRIVASFPRRCIFAGTTNKWEFLKDETGGRRFWPAKVGIIDLNNFEACRDQLWAEAVVYYKKGENWWLDPNEEQLAQIEQEAVRQPDPWEPTLGGHLRKIPTEVTELDHFGYFNDNNIEERFDGSGRRLWTTTGELLSVALNIPPSQQNKHHQTRCGNCLKALGWERKRERIEKGKREYRYYENAMTF